MWPSTDLRRPFALSLLGLSGLAWLTLVLWGQSPYARYLSHHSLDEVRGGGSLMGVFAAGWLVMLVAMMLPTRLPLVMMFHIMVNKRPDKRQLTGLLLIGYLSMWTGFGMLVYLGDSALHALVANYAWLVDHAWTFTAAALLLAGLYQFTPSNTTAWTSAGRRSASSLSTGVAAANAARRFYWVFTTAYSALAAAGR